MTAGTALLSTGRAIASLLRLLKNDGGGRRRAGHVGVGERSETMADSNCEGAR